MIIFRSLESILSIVIIISLGYYLTERGWFDDGTSVLLTKLVTRLSLPVYMVVNLVTTFDRAKLYELSGGLVVPVASILLSYLIGVALSRRLNLPPGRRGTFQTMFCISNTIFIGLPVNLALFGEKSIPYALLYYIANTVFFWTIGVYSISRDGDGREAGLFSPATLRKIFSPPLLGFLLGIILVVLELPLPAFLLDTGKYLGNLTTPLSMLFIGMAIHAVDFRAVRFSRDMAVLMLGRMLITPAVVIILSHFVRAPLLMKEVFIIQASLPIMTQVSIIARAYNADSEYAAVMTTLTTLQAVVSIPFFMYLIDKIRFFIL
ncbi:MAG: AEC family transporter [bacterium]|jgi:predicted permease